MSQVEVAPSRDGPKARCRREDGIGAAFRTAKAAAMTAVLQGVSRDAFERDPAAFRAEWQAANDKLQKRVVKARKLLPEVKAGADVLRLCADLCQRLGTDGLRAELTLLRASRALAALEGKRHIQATHVRRMAVSALRHRLRRNPLDDADNGVRVSRCVDEVMGA